MANHRSRLQRASVAAVLAAALAVQPLALAPTSGPEMQTAAADPPAWAPAHGYRAKHKGKSKQRHYDHEEEVVVAAPTYGIPSGRCYREEIGQVLGGIAGAAVGSQIGDGTGRLIAIIGGAAIGVLVGGSIGRAMDRADYACVDHTLEYAETGQTVAWENPDNGAQYRVTPKETYQNAQGRYCREYVTEAVIDGRTRQVYGTACRQPDGSWERQA